MDCTDGRTLTLKELRLIHEGLKGGVPDGAMPPQCRLVLKRMRNCPGGLLTFRNVLGAALAIADQSEDPSVGTDGPANAESETLSQRQSEILSWVARGKSNSVIALILGISQHTVDTHLRRINEKLGTSDRTVAAVTAVQRGLISVAA